MHAGVVLFSNRIYVALGGENSEAVECSSQSLAASLANTLETSGTWGGDKSTSTGIVNAVLATAEEWATSCDPNLTEGMWKLIPAPVFRRFANLAGLHLSS